jgi:serine/threonine-protein kinase
VALYVFGILFVVWLVQGSHVPNPVQMWTMFQNSIGTALFWGAFLWVLYSALEPYVRRRWPARIISWRRLLEGRFRDPLVGRDVLIGVLFGTGLTMLSSLWFLASGWIGRPPSAPSPVLFETLLDARSGISAILMMQLSAIANAMFFLFVLLLLHVILRVRWLAMVVFVLFMMPIAMAGSLDPKGQLLLGLIVLVTVVVVLVRFGLLTLMSLLWARTLLEIFPITHHLTEWRGGAALLPLGVLLALLLYGYLVSLGGRPLFSGRMFQD